MSYPRYLSVKEVATLLNISVKTVYKMKDQGVIPGHFQLGSMHFFDEEELLRGLKDLATQKKTVIKFQHSRTDDRHGLLK